MKKNSISTAVLASLAGIAGIANISSAVNINPDGTGQILIYPYYTVNANNQTLLSVINTTSRGKAVKVRILEGRNSQEVLDFNLFLSREDVWTAGILSLGDANGPASIITADRSCTAPNFLASGDGVTAGGFPFVNFRNFQYITDTAGGVGLDRTREGHIEIIEMAVLAGALDTAITHVSTNDTPPNCAGVAAGVGALFTSPPTANPTLNPPSGGLFGSAAVINIANGTYTNYSATALDAFWTPNAIGYSSPDSVLPSLANAGSPISGTVINGVVTGAQSLVFSNGRVITSNWGQELVEGVVADRGQRIDAVSAVFMADSLLNEYSTLTSNNEASEWVITFPTKRFYVDARTDAIPPFTSAYLNGQSCDPIGIRSWNREELTSAPQGGFSPPQATLVPSLCFESNVLTFNQTITNQANGTSSPSKILGSTLARNINTPSLTAGSRAGWTRINFASRLGGASTTRDRQTRASLESHRFVGLPVSGFWAISIENNNATPGVKGFYGGAYNHRNSRDCVSGPVGAFTCFTP